MQLIDDFLSSDLLYGETGDRMKYLPEIDKKFKVAQHLPAVTIDRMTNSYKVEKGLKSGTRWDDVRNQVEEANKDLAPQHHVLLPADVQQFYEFAQRHQKFGPKLVGQAQLPQDKALKREEMAKQDKVPMRKGRDPTKPFLRSKCKAGIAFVVERGFTIRFLLDSLDEKRLKAIFHKEFEQPWYTGSELRYIFRNRDVYRDKVVFYRLGEVCKSPWEEFPEIIPKDGVPGTQFVAKTSPQATKV
jgi:hypothetical protein